MQTDGDAMTSRTLFLAVAVIAPAIAQMQNNQQRTLSCTNNYDGTQAHFCEIREQNIAAGGRLSLDPGSNGGISIKGWDLPGVLVRERVDAWAASDADAHAIASQVQVQIAGASITATGPALADHSNWSVSFEVFVPHTTDLDLKAHNGGIRISDVKGDIGFATTNGGVTLQRLAGNVHGQTTNGGLSVELEGTRWDGAELNVETQNGGVKLSMPANYSAHLETGTVNGHIAFGIPITVHGEIGRQLSTDLGSGGAPIRVMTTNGGVKISQL
jgi:hypothetical protein